MPPKRRSKRKVSGGAERGPPAKRVQVDLTQMELEGEQKLYQDVLDDIKTWDEIRRSRITVDSVADAFNSLAERLGTSLLTVYPNPSVEDYQRLDFTLSDVLYFTIDAHELPNRHLHRELARALVSAREVVHSLRNAMFLMALNRPSLVRELVALAKLEMQTVIQPPAPKLDKPEQLECLLPEHWLNAHVLNYFVDAWTLQGAPTRIVAETFLCTTHFLDDEGRPLSELRERTQAVIGKRAQTKNWFNYKEKVANPVHACTRLLLPLHKDKNHWVVFFVDLETQKMALLDSLTPDPEFETGVAKLVTKVLDLILPEAQIFTLVKTQIPRQQNVVDCGIHTLAWLEHLLYGEPCPYDGSATFTSTQLAKSARSAGGYRAHFAQEFFKFLKHSDMIRLEVISDSEL
ncbi:hypothetical protein BDZ89DRAFT_1040552 [Hymenopellis radicata]|nr:hypothetical protein BDZ89DRAFT_1040552 [Hymenopellis radicata]